MRMLLLISWEFPLGLSKGRSKSLVGQWELRLLHILPPLFNLALCSLFNTRDAIALCSAVQCDYLPLTGPQAAI